RLLVKAKLRLLNWNPNIHLNEVPMPLKFTNTPQLKYGDAQRNNVWNRYPAHAKPISTAPITSQPLRVFDATGKSQWALHHRGTWRILAPYKDSFTGQAQWRMNGDMIGQPTMWASS